MKTSKKLKPMKANVGKFLLSKALDPKAGKSSKSFFESIGKFPFVERRMKLSGSDALKAAKATRYGKIALGVVGAGLAAKQYLKSKMSDGKKEEPKNTNASVKAKRLKELEGELNIDSKRGGGMVIARGYKLTKAKPTKLY